MKGKMILEDTFGITFKDKGYYSQVLELDASYGSASSKANIIKIMCELCRVVDEMEKEIKDLKEQYATTNTKRHTDSSI